MEQQVDRFKAVDEEGRTYTVIAMQRIVPSGHSDIPPRLGMKRFMLSSGEDLNPGEDDTFHIALTCRIIKKVG